MACFIKYEYHFSKQIGSHSTFKFWNAYASHSLKNMKCSHLVGNSVVTKVHKYMIGICKS